MVERKLFMQIQSINIVYPNVENMIAKPITKRMEIVMGIQVNLISWMNFDCKENSGKKAFLANPSINIMYPNVENLTVAPITKTMEIIMCIHVCPFSRMNSDYMENGGKKSFLAYQKQ